MPYTSLIKLLDHEPHSQCSTHQYIRSLLGALSSNLWIAEVEQEGAMTSRLPETGARGFNCWLITELLASSSWRDVNRWWGVGREKALLHYTLKRSWLDIDICMPENSAYVLLWIMRNGGRQFNKFSNHQGSFSIRSSDPGQLSSHRKRVQYALGKWNVCERSRWTDKGGKLRNVIGLPRVVSVDG